MDYKKACWICFGAGVLFTCGLHMLVQDWLGLEGYIMYLQAHWVNLHWSVGAIAMLLGIAEYLFVRGR